MSSSLMKLSLHLDPQGEIVEEIMNMEDKESSEESDDSEAIETLEDVQQLTVKSSKESEEIKDSEEKDISTEVDKDDEGDDSMREGESSKTEDKEQEESSQKDKDESLLMDEEDVKKEEQRREKMKVLLSGYLELKTKKEIEKALLNEKKIVAQWLYPFRGTYQKEWELEMKKLKLGFQKTLDFKKSHIHAIQQERKLVELNHLWADSADYRISEELFEFLRIRCEKLKVRYLEELEETKKYYLEREKEIVEKCSKAEERAKALVLMRKSVHEKTLQKTQETLERFKDEGEYLKKKEIEAIKQKHLTHVERITQELQNSISPPEHKIEEIRALFLEWKLKYESFIHVSEKSRKKLDKFSSELPQLETKVAEARKKLADIRNENKMAKQKGIEEIIALQRMAKKYEKLDPPLRNMISASEEVMVQLRERKTKLDKIIKLKKACDKLETESDKMMSNVTFLDSSDMDQLKENDCLPLIKELCSDHVEDHNLLQNLHQKISRTKLQNQFLLHNIENLEIENKALRCDMKKYLQLVSSGEWNRISDEDYVTLYQTSEKFEKSHLSHAHSRKDAQDIIYENLKLLNKKYRSVNDEIIKQTEKNFNNPNQ